MTHELTQAQTDDLRALAGFMIPASPEHNVPGADDPLIQADLLATLGRDAPAVRAALDHLAQLAGGSFASLPADKQIEAAMTLRAMGGAAVAVLSRVVLQVYYRDDRVVRSLGLEPRPPFPQGHVLEDDGDWSLLEPVKQRAPMWQR
jgi:hypothetical protein